MNKLTSLQKKVLDVLSGAATPLNGPAIQKQVGSTLSVAGAYKILNELSGIGLATIKDEPKIVGKEEIRVRTYAISEKGKELYSAESSSV